jgi:hypothetical protein
LTGLSFTAADKADVAYITQHDLQADEKDVSYEYQVHLVLL